MADFLALRELIYDLMRGRDKRHPLFNANSLYKRLERSATSRPPVSRTTFYSWFGGHQALTPPTAILLECVPALAEILNVNEYELYHAAGILPREIDTAISLSAAANEFRAAFGVAARALERAGLSSAGEALVVDRILNHGLDYKITLWPITRGTKKPIHLHSWIVLEPVETVMSRRRESITYLEDRPVSQRRHYIRHAVIRDGLWRSLGLRWRTIGGPEWPYSSFPPLCIEVPVEERNRRPIEDKRRPRLDPSRILAISAPFAHSELLVALVAEALGFGTFDLRYQGFPETRFTDELARFCVDKLIDRTPLYAWSIAQDADFLRTIKTNILGSAARHLIICSTFGSRARALGSRVWGISAAALRAAQDVSAEIVYEVNQKYPVIIVDYEDSDYVTVADGSPRSVDFNLLTDHVRFSAAEILNLLLAHHSGPPAPQWGNRFDDLRYGVATRATIPDRLTRVRWCEVGSLNRPLRRR